MRNNTKFKLFILILILIPGISEAAKKRSINFYKNKWCIQHVGKPDVTYHNSMTIDCVTNDYVFIFDYSYRWRKAIGKALYFSIETGKRAGIVLIIERARERFYFRQLKNLIRYFSLPIDIFQVGSGVGSDEIN